MGYRDCHVQTLMGSAIYERAYYHCVKCHHGQAPTDEEFGLDDKHSPACREVISLVGLIEAFDEGADIAAERLAGLRISASSVRRITENVGAELAQRRSLGETFGPDELWSWPTDRQGKTTACVSVDLTGVRQQGPHAEAVEGRMAAVAVVFRDEPGSRKETRRTARYVSGLFDGLDGIGQELRAECQAVGIASADQVLALLDGGAGLEPCVLQALAGTSQHVIFILDFWHAAQHLQEFANLFVRDEVARKEQMQKWCETLKHRGGSVLLRELEALDFSSENELMQQARQQLTSYLRNNLHRTDYPTYVRNGWPIGSGRVESACKSVVATRLKGPGMRWRARGTNALCHLRALFKSERSAWQSFWSRDRKPTKLAA